MKNSGAGIIVPSWTPKGENVSFLERTLNLSVLSNIVGRWVKVSDYGQTEKLREIKQESRQEKAKAALETNKKIKEAVEEYTSGIKDEENKTRIERELLRQVFGGQGEVEKIQVTNLLKKFRISVLRGESDVQVNEVISSQTNAEKLQVLMEIHKTKETEDFNTMVNQLIQYKVISVDTAKELQRKIQTEKELNKQSSIPVTKILADAFKNIDFKLVREVHAAELDTRRVYLNELDKKELPKEKKEKLFDKFIRFLKEFIAVGKTKPILSSRGVPDKFTEVSPGRFISTEFLTEQNKATPTSIPTSTPTATPTSTPTIPKPTPTIYPGFEKKNLEVQDTIRNKFKNVGGKDVANEAINIAARESGLNPKLVHPNDDTRKTTDYGLFQINDYWQRENLKKYGYTIEDMLDPEKATDFALKLYKAQGNKWGNT